MTDLDWQLKGACRNHPTVEPDAWFPVQGDPITAREAINICRNCPVIWPCATYALDNSEASGIWGGLREGERKAIIRGRTRRHECGSHLAYQDHRRHDEPIDQACQAAFNEHQRQYRAKRRAREAARNQTEGASST